MSNVGLQAPENPDASDPGFLPDYSLFDRYRPSNRYAAEPIRYAKQAGWLTVGLALVLIWAEPGKAAMGLWSTFGLALGTLFLLQGALDLRSEHVTKTHSGVSLAQSLDRWFPSLLFIVQTIYLFLIVTLLWLSAINLGMNVPTWLHVNLYVLLTLIPIRRLIAEWANHKGYATRATAQELLHYITVIVVTLLFGVAMTHVISPLGHPISGDNSVPIMVIWVVASLIILSCVILMIDRTFSKRRRP